MPDPPITPIKPEDCDTKCRLARAARQLFLEKGYAATSVNEIVASAGVSKPVLYYHFRNKEDIYLAILGHAHEGMLRVLRGENAQPAETELDRLLDLADRVYAYCEGQVETARLVYMDLYGFPQGTPPFDCEPYCAAFEAAFRGVVDQGLARGEFAGDAAAIQDLVLSIIDSALGALISRDEQRMLGREGLRRTLTLAFRGFAATTPTDIESESSIP